jgi:hypothetical protein
MSGIAEIQQAILCLPAEDYQRLRQWFTDLDWEKWDREIEVDAAAGRLDSLVAEALESKENGTLQEL